MNTRNRISHGVAFAFAFSLAVAAVHAVAGPVLGSGFVLRLAIGIVGLAYVLFVLRDAELRVGRFTAVVFWLVVVGVLWLFPVPIGLYLLVHVGLIWLIRSLVRYSSLVPAAMDLGLSLLALVAGLWAAMETRSVGIAFWTFLLVQALYVKIPRALKPMDRTARVAPENRFDVAYRSAEAALRRIR